MGERLTTGRARRDRTAGLAWGSTVSPLSVDPKASGGGRSSPLGGYVALLVLAVVVFTVYRFCNTDGTLFAGSSTGTALGAFDGAVPGLLVLVAFVVFRPLAAAVADGRAPTPVRRSLARVAVAVLPVYYLSVLVVWFLRQSGLPGDWYDLLEHLTFTQVFDSRRIFYTIGPAWAVSVTVLLVLLLVALVALVHRICARLGCDRRARLRMLWTTTGLLAGVALVWRVWSYGVQHRSPQGSFTTWYGPVACLDAFALGMGLALAVVVLGNRPLDRAVATRWALRAAGLGVLAATALAREHVSWVTAYAATASAVGFSLLLAAEVLGGGPGDAWTRALQRRPLQWFSAASLSIYLWHEPVLLALRETGLVRQAPDAFMRDLLLTVVATGAVSWASYTAVQVPAARLAALGHPARPSARPATT